MPGADRDLLVYQLVGDYLEPTDYGSLVATRMATFAESSSTYAGQDCVQGSIDMSQSNPPSDISGDHDYPTEAVQYGLDATYGYVEHDISTEYYATSWPLTLQTPTVDGIIPTFLDQNVSALSSGAFHSLQHVPYPGPLVDHYKQHTTPHDILFFDEHAQDTDVKLFRCQWEGCSKAYTTKVNLKAHFNTHIGERPYHCFCGKKFTRVQDLNRHSDTVHDVKPKHTCSKCGRGFGRKDEKDRHERKRGKCAKPRRRVRRD